MTKFIRHFIALCFLITPFALFGKSGYSEKIVHVSVGHVSLSTLLKSISSQTACVFSYDPVKINDKQIIVVTAVLNCNLNSALQKLLPKNIQFRFRDKFIVLQKVSIVAKEVSEKKAVTPVIVKSTVEPPKIQPVATTDSVKLKPIIVESVVAVHSEPITEILKADTVVIAQPESVVAEVQTLLPPGKSLVSSKNKGFGQFIKNNGVLEVEMSAYGKQLGGAVHLGLFGLYAILSIGKKSDKVKSSGVGIGAAFKVHKHIGLNLDILKLNLLSGKTYDLGIRTVTTQFRPEINYYLGSSVKLFAGPTFNILNSTYSNSIKTYHLGKIFYYGGIVGVKVDLNHLFRKSV